jgi:hypothetical protein
MMDNGTGGSNLKVASQMARMKNSRWLTLTAVVVLIAASATACGSDEKGSDGGGGSRISSTARISIVEPQPGAVVPADQAIVRLELAGGKIIPRATTQVRPDEGHIHLKLDGRIVTLLGGLEERLTGLAPGQHLLEAEFAAGDHTPFNPRVIETVTFTVQ